MSERWDPCQHAGCTECQATADYRTNPMKPIRVLCRTHAIKEGFTPGTPPLDAAPIKGSIDFSVANIKPEEQINWEQKRRKKAEQAKLAMAKNQAAADSVRSTIAAMDRATHAVSPKPSIISENAPPLAVNTPKISPNATSVSGKESASRMVHIIELNRDLPLIEAAELLGVTDGAVKGTVAPSGWKRGGRCGGKTIHWADRPAPGR